MSLERIELLERQMAELDAQMRLRVEPFLPQSEPRDTMPGGEATAAHAILGEIGPDMSRFGAAARLASWARLSPGHNASAGQRRQGRTGQEHRSFVALVFRGNVCLFTGHQLCLHPGKIVPGQGKFGMETEGLFKSRNGLLIQTEFS